MRFFLIDQHIAEGETLPTGVPYTRSICPATVLERSRCFGNVNVSCWAATRSSTFCLGNPIAFKDEAEGRSSQRKLAALDFQAVVFGHGRAITKDGRGKLRHFVARCWPAFRPS